jgi:hypothetical protein
MKKFLLKVFLLLTAFTLFTLDSVTFSQSSNFEGRVKILMDDGVESAQMEYYLKGSKMRIEIMAEEQMIMITNEDKKFMLMPQQKMYTEFPANTMEELSGLTEDESEESMEDEFGEDFNIEDLKTGETKNILGKECERWIFGEGEGKVEMWVARDFGTFMGLQNPMGGTEEGVWWKEVLGDSGFFPMEIVEKDAGGNVLSSFKVAEIEEKSLGDDLFSVPSGYKKMNMMGMPE